jgi:hypothetical protein
MKKTLKVDVSTNCNVKVEDKNLPLSLHTSADLYAICICSENSFVAFPKNLF